LSFIHPIIISFYLHFISLWLESLEISYKIFY
jgi:hypothetical protein